MVAWEWVAFARIFCKIGSKSDSDEIMCVSAEKISASVASDCLLSEEIAFSPWNWRYEGLPFAVYHCNINPPCSVPIATKVIFIRFEKEKFVGFSKNSASVKTIISVFERF